MELAICEVTSKKESAKFEHELGGSSCFFFNFFSAKRPIWVFLPFPRNQRFQINFVTMYGEVMSYRYVHTFVLFCFGFFVISEQYPMIWFYNYSSLAWPSWTLLPKAGSFMAFLRQENRQSHWPGLAMKQIGNENNKHDGNCMFPCCDHIEWLGRTDRICWIRRIRASWEGRED